MPQIVDLGAHYGQVSFPDDYTPEQIVAEYDGLEKARNAPPTLSTLDYAKNVGGRLLRGAAGMVASIPEELAIAASGLSRLTGASDAIVGEGDPTRAEDRASYQLGQAIRRGAEYIAPTNPALNESFLASKLPEGVGSAVGFMAGGLAGKALKVPAWLSIGGLGSASSGADFYHDAKASGADEGTAQLASVIGNAVGTSEAFPLARMMHRLDGITGNTFSKFVIEAGKDTIEEALQEGAQQLAQNFTAQQLYDKDRSFFNEVSTNTGVGGATGFLMSALTQALGIPIGRSRMRREGTERRQRGVAQFENERITNAESLRSQPQTPGQETQAGQEAVGGVRVRLPTENGLEAEAGTPIANATTTIPTPVTQGAPPTAPGVTVESATVPEAAAAIETPAAGVQPLTTPQSVVQEAISATYGIEQGSVGWQEIQSETPAPPIAIPRLQQLVAGITSQWANAPTVTVVQSVDQLPENVRAQAAKLGLTRNAAVADGNRVWMVANNITDEERAKRLLLHEAVGHIGVAAVFETPQQFNAFMQGVAESHAATPLGQQATAIYGNDPIMLGEEIVAKLAENSGADPTLWQQIVAIVRNWVRRVFALDVSDNDIRVLLMKSRRSVEGQPTSGQQAAGRIRFSASGSTSVFPNREAVVAAISNPGLTQEQVQEAEAMASVQSSMVTTDMANWLQEPPADKVEKRAKKILQPLLDIALLSPVPRPLSSFPEGTTEEKRTKELAGWSQLAHHGVHRSLAADINSHISVAQVALTEAMKKTAATTQAQHKSNFLTATFKRLTTDFRTYLVNRAAAASAAGNLDAQFRERLNRAQERLNEQEQSPTAVRHALSAIARTVPDNLLIPTITVELGSNVDAPIDTTAFNRPVVDWAIQNGALFGIVGDSVRDWLLVDDGTGTPALMHYNELLEDLQALKDILNNEAQVNTDIDAFEAWFKNAATGKGVSAKDFAEQYFKLRTGRDSAMRIIAANERDIDREDLKLRANTTARDRLAAMMSDPGYNASVREAKAQADIVIRSLYDPDKPLEPPVGLINRDRAVGTWILKGPMSQFNYDVDLHPSSAGEAQNIEKLGAFAAEARAWAIQNAATDPLKADEFNTLAGYIEGHLMSASLNPKQGFTMTRVRILFTNIRMPIDPFDGITSLTGLGWSFHTVRDVIERIGGRAVNQAFKDAAVLDTAMRKVEAADQHPEYGRAAQTQAVLKALESHGWSIDQKKRWNQRIAEPVLAAGQNRMSPTYEVDDVIVGADAKLTAADVAALRLMKRWTDAINAAAPHMIEDRLAELGITRKQLGNGKYTGPRVDAQWTENFVKKWNAAPTDAAKADLLTGEEEFLDVVLGYIAEFNSEFGKMNPASSEKSPLFLLYRRLADTEKSGVETFRDWNEVVQFLATTGTTMPMPGTNMPMFPDYVTAANQVQATLFSEIKAFIKTFDDTVLHYESTTVWGGVPTALVQAVSGRNAFTTARRRLVAPSSFYTYSMATAAQQQKYVGSLRSLLNLQLLQSGYEAQRALEGKKLEMEQRIEAIVKTGVRDRKARRQVQKETAKERQLGEIRYSLSELSIALKSIEKAFGNVERYENAATEYYEHAGIAAANSFFSAIKASLLSSVQAITTNSFGGVLLGPAIAHWQMGQFGRAMGDIAIQPALMAKTVMKRVSALVEGNPMMSRLLRTHAPLWDDLAEAVIKGAADWRRVQHIAQSTGMVNPYNLGTVLKNMGALKRTAGRFTSDDPNHIAEAVNIAMSAPGVRHVTEGLKAFVPREFDNAINYMMIINFDREVEMLRKLGWVAFQNRESSAAATSADWKDISKPENLLTPGDLGLKTNKALEWFRQLFIPLGSLDGVLRDYYERTKTMTPEQRSEEPLLSDDDHAALALQYAAKSNVSVETNRPYSLKGKGSDGFMRNVVGTFMGWGINMMHQLSKGLQTHSKDKQFPAIANSMIGIATIVLLMAAVGAWNWEFGDELTKKLYDVSSARVQLGNIKDWRTGLLYFAQALVNTVPMIGSSIGGLFGVAYTGRGNPFDMTSLSPHIGFVAGIWNTARRIMQTGDATLPLTDFARQWVPMSKMVLNRVPTVRGLVDQQNAVRSMNASAPPGTEIKWGKRGGGDVKYSPANDEVQRLIASAYEVAAHGGDPALVQARLQEAIAAYVAAGRSPEDAVKALTSALSSKEPIRVLTGREMTPEEEAKWVSRMTKDQKADYDKSVAAWSILSAATGKDFNMVTTKGTGGGGGSIPSRAVGIGGGTLRPAGSGLAGNRIGRGIGTRRRGLPGRRRIGVAGTSRRRLGGPRIGRATTRRRGIGTGSRRRYALA